ncbi:DUF2948 family protein [Cereibacter azotoformans]|uniref:DUF2948 family protein n=1 Tax=Cereibacter azotoformans TaxID=43057 RepID=A0A2T5K6Z7_9RHOB|nr:DUF2948 family protein [Cereibacter azotoformans]AXQ92816.1 DUF2948 family protein [Cereibacter sphaeroides]MBO4169518.1 DUF2948 family protein [Cereibacter azotoformans]PTR18196.1 hypothetical protein C8J28_109155 [Cereibacter azotoformans]UIJ31100.1 DUF2948 family protein [Cereibacter azotoformans]
MADARFEDADEGPLYLGAETAEDLGVVSALVQDAVLSAQDMRWLPRKRRFALLLNRFRWEDREAAEREGRPYERVRSVLAVEGVLAVRTQGIDRTDRDLVLSLLALEFEPDAEGGGRLVLVLAGDGAVELEVEALEVVLKDVTRPYVAPSGRVPEHRD